MLNLLQPIAHKYVGLFAALRKATTRRRRGLLSAICKQNSTKVRERPYKGTIIEERLDSRSKETIALAFNDTGYETYPQLEPRLPKSNTERNNEEREATGHLKNLINVTNFKLTGTTNRPS